MEILIVSTQAFLGNRRDETEREDQMSKIKIRNGWVVASGEERVNIYLPGSSTA